MNLYKDVLEYENIVGDILLNEKFLLLKDIPHHGYNRYIHSLRVSKISFIIAKRFNLDFRSVARGALLHDFFFVDNSRINIKDKLITLFNHPMYAYLNASKYFDINKKEKNIILSHMFPIGKYLPLTLESLLVDLIDDIISIIERAEYYKTKFKLIYIDVSDN